jgi:ketosteroid isomerase-like protein
MNETDLNRAAVEQYVAAFNANDASAVPLADDAVHRGPMVPDAIRGADAVRAYIGELAPFITRMELKQLVVEGDLAAAVLAFEGFNGRIVEGAEFFRFRDGQICERQAFFDTAPLMEGVHR